MKFANYLRELKMLTPDDATGTGGDTPPPTEETLPADAPPVDDAPPAALPPTDDEDDEALVDAAVAAMDKHDDAVGAEPTPDQVARKKAAARRDKDKPKPKPDAVTPPVDDPVTPPVAETPPAAATGVSGDVMEIAEARARLKIEKEQFEQQRAAADKPDEKPAPDTIDIGQLRRLAQHDPQRVFELLGVDAGKLGDHGAALIHSTLDEEDIPADARMQLQNQRLMYRVEQLETQQQEQATKVDQQFQQSQLAARHESFVSGILNFATSGISAESHPYLTRQKNKYADGDNRVANEMYTLARAYADSGDSTVYSPSDLAGAMEKNIRDLVELHHGPQGQSAPPDIVAPVSAPPRPTHSTETAPPSGGGRSRSKKPDPADLSEDELIERMIAAADAAG